MGPPPSGQLLELPGGHGRRSAGTGRRKPQLGNLTAAVVAGDAEAHEAQSSPGIAGDAISDAHTCRSPGGAEPTRPLVERRSRSSSRSACATWPAFRSAIAAIGAFAVSVQPYVSLLKVRIRAKGVERILVQQRRILDQVHRAPRAVCGASMGPSSVADLPARPGADEVVGLDPDHAAQRRLMAKVAVKLGPVDPPGNADRPPHRGREGLERVPVDHLDPTCASGLFRQTGSGRPPRAGVGMGR